MIKILLVEDSRIAKNMLESQIAQSPDCMLIASIENAANAEIICMRGNVDLILMDVCTADNESGLAAAKKIKSHSPAPKIIIMTSMPEYSFISKAKAAGCEGFWYKEYGDLTLFDIIERVMDGEKVYPDETPEIIIGEAKSSELTERELDVIRQLAMGLKYDEIAAALNISQNTVKYHVKNLLIKTGYHSAMQLVVDVISKKLVLPGF